MSEPAAAAETQSELLGSDSKAFVKQVQYCVVLTLDCILSWSWYPMLEGGPARVPQKMLPSENKYAFILLHPTHFLSYLCLHVSPAFFKLFCSSTELLSAAFFIFILLCLVFPISLLKPACVAFLLVKFSFFGCQLFWSSLKTPEMEIIWIYTAFTPALEMYRQVTSMNEKSIRCVNASFGLSCQKLLCSCVATHVSKWGSTYKMYVKVKL